jgi:adenylate cyclase
MNNLCFFSLQAAKGDDPVNTEDFKRKLTAILSADVEGYSRLMGEDEDRTVRTLTAYRGLMSGLIQRYRGRVVDSPGDNLLAEFGSVMDAVRCAVEIQEELRIRNAELPEGHKMQFRIGINLGDVIEDGGRIYGDGINVAARVEGLADSGGICISGGVYDAIKNKLSMSYDFLGEHTVKNIKEPVRVYRIRMEPEAAVAIEKEKKARLMTWQRAAMSFVAIFILVAVAFWYFSSRQAPVVSNLEEAPKTIAVLPFVSMSSDPEQKYFTDGLSEELGNTLAQIPNLGVTAMTSSFSFKGTNKKVQEIADELGVNHILEGSVRKAGNVLRITAQLIRASDGLHLWSKTYNREINDILDTFTIQEDIAKEVADQLKITLALGTDSARPGLVGVEDPIL